MEPGINTNTNSSAVSKGLYGIMGTKQRELLSSLAEGKKIFPEPISSAENKGSKIQNCKTSRNHVVNTVTLCPRSPFHPKGTIPVTAPGNCLRCLESRTVRVLFFNSTWPFPPLAWQLSDWQWLLESKPPIGTWLPTSPIYLNSHTPSRMHFPLDAHLLTPQFSHLSIAQQPPLHLLRFLFFHNPKHHATMSAVLSSGPAGQPLHQPWLTSGWPIHRCSRTQGLISEWCLLPAEGSTQIWHSLFGPPANAQDSSETFTGVKDWQT